MKVLQVLPELRVGGVERGVVDLSRYLVEQGHEVVVVSAGGPLVEQIQACGARHVYLPVHQKSLFALFKSSRELTRLIRNEKIDLIHARSRVPALSAFLSSWRTGVPFITTCHGIYKPHLFSRVMGWGKLVIVPSEAVARHMRDHFGVPPDRLRLIHRGVDMKVFQAVKKERPPLPLQVGLIGRLSPSKGHHLFLKALARVHRVLPPLKVFIVGGAQEARSRYQEELLTLVRQLGLSRIVEFLGTRYDIPSILSTLDLVVVPSTVEESFGRSVIEAGACGVPVVATRLGALEEIIEHEKTGLLVEPDDPNALAEAIIRILKDKAFASQLALNLKTKVERLYPLNQMFEKTLSVYEETLRVKRILVIKLAAVGDVVLSLPSIRAVRERYPDGFITVLVGYKSRQIIRNCPYINDLIVYEHLSGRKSKISFLKVASLLRKEHFDIVIDLQNNKLSRFLAYLSTASIRMGYGRNRWAFLLNVHVRDLGYSVSPVEDQARAMKLLGFESFNKDLELWVRPEEEEKIDDFLKSEWFHRQQTLVGINPGSSPRWPTKRWPTASFARLCDELAKKNIRVVLTGGEDDKPIGDEILKLTKVRPMNAIGRTSITELGALLKHCGVFVTSDSAPMHIAASVGTPLVALFGPTDPNRHLVPSERSVVIQKDISCSPCYLKTCPIGHICMHRISVGEVLGSVLKFVGHKSSSLSLTPSTGSVTSTVR